MASILLNWLNSELQISSAISKESLQNDFSNGYLFGKILHKYQLQDDFNKFLAGSDAEDTLNNFDRLQPKFKLLKVPFDINIATDIIFKKPGAASQTLYHLYTALENAKKQGTSLTLLLINQASAESKKQSFDLPIFRDQLRRRLPRKIELNLQEMNTNYQKIQKSNQEKAIQKELKLQEAINIKRRQNALKTKEKKIARDQKDPKLMYGLAAVEKSKQADLQRKRQMENFERKIKINKQIKAELKNSCIGEGLKHENFIVKNLNGIEQQSKLIENLPHNTEIHNKDIKIMKKEIDKVQMQIFGPLEF